MSSTVDFCKEVPDNYFYNIANKWEKGALNANRDGAYALSWALSAAARLPYVVDVIVNIVAIPLALLGMLLGAISAAVTLGKNVELLSYNANKLMEKINHFGISLFGAMISPWAAYKARDLNVVLICT